MRTQTRRWKLASGALLSTLLIAGSAAANEAATVNNPKFSFAPERSTMHSAIVYGSSTMLVRTDEFISATVHTQGMTPGYVYTLWIVIFNNPDECATDPCTPADIANPKVQASLLNGGAQIPGPDGAGDFGEVRLLGDVTRAHVAGPGLLDPRRAEIHLAIRTHGPASSDPAVLTQQFTTFNGGCPPNTCATVQAAVHQP